MCSHWICCPLNPYCFTVITVKQMLSYPGLLHSIYLLMQMLDFTFISIIFHPVGFRSVSRNVIKPWFCSSRAITSQPCCLERYCYFCTSGWPMMYIWNLGERWRQETYFLNFHLGNTLARYCTLHTLSYFIFTLGQWKQVWISHFMNEDSEGEGTKMKVSCSLRDFSITSLSDDWACRCS